jgi:hypothetical protein
MNDSGSYAPSIQVAIRVPSACGMPGNIDFGAMEND